MLIAQIPGGVPNGDVLNRVDRNTGQYTFYRTAGPAISPRPTSIIEDRSGFLWVGTGGLGLTRYDLKTGVFKKFRHSPTDPFSLSSDHVAQLFIDHAGRLWAATFDGLDRFDPATSASLCIGRSGCLTRQ